NRAYTEATPVLHVGGVEHPCTSVHSAGINDRLPSGSTRIRCSRPCCRLLPNTASDFPSKGWCGRVIFTYSAEWWRWVVCAVFPESLQHRGHTPSGRIRRTEVPRDGNGSRRNAGRTDCARSDSAYGGAGDCETDRRSTGSGARKTRGPPGPETGKREDHAGRQSQGT